MINPEDYNIVVSETRGTLEQLYSVLSSFVKPTVKSRAQTKVRVNHPRFTNVFNYLLVMGFIEKVDIRTSYKSRSRTTEMYVITMEGKGAIVLYGRLFDLLGLSSQIPRIDI